jgi:hypothetical protein
MINDPYNKSDHIPKIPKFPKVYIDQKEIWHHAFPNDITKFILQNILSGQQRKLAHDFGPAFSNYENNAQIFINHSIFFKYSVTYIKKRRSLFVNSSLAKMCSAASNKVATAID